MEPKMMRVTTSRMALAVFLCASAAAAETTPDLIRAAQAGDRPKVADLLSKSADPKGVDGDGTTALHWSVRRGDVQITKLLVKSGAKVGVTDRYGVTPMSLSSLNGDAELTAVLLDAGADVESANPAGETALMFAARNGSIPTLELLLQRGASVNAKERVRGQTALMWAVGENHQDAVRFLIAHGADVKAQSSVYLPPPVPAQRLGQAAGAGIVRQKAPAAPQGAMSPLLYAVRDDNREMVKLLMSSGAKINQPDANGTTPLLLALINGHIDLAKFLIDQNADINAADGYGRTPLFSAIDARNAGHYANPYDGSNETDALDVIKTLLDRGARADVRTKAVVPNRGWQQTDGSWVNFTGQTPFLRAALAGDITVMRLLLAHGANANLATEGGTTPLMAAAGVNYVAGRTFTRSRNETLEAVKLCIENGAEVNAQNSLGFTAAHGAANRGLDDVLHLLAEHGANLDVKDKEGRTPLAFADGVFLAVTPPTPRPETAKLIRELLQKFDSKAGR